ncbi:MAG: hypothetical protein JSV00_10720 [bacterium]|nr:MAG: hypothetical protein JSV00_10720 [bacterium]
MKSDRLKAEVQEIELLDEVHRTEEEIDRFLRANAEEAEGVLAGARKQAEEQMAETAHLAQVRMEEKRSDLLREAEEEASRILAEGNRALEMEEAVLEKRKPLIMARILDHLLGRQT